MPRVTVEAADKVEQTGLGPRQSVGNSIAIRAAARLPMLGPAVLYVVAVPARPAGEDVAPSRFASLPPLVRLCVGAVALLDTLYVKAPVGEEARRRHKYGGVPNDVSLKVETVSNEEVGTKDSKAIVRIVAKLVDTASAAKVAVLEQANTAMLASALQRLNKVVDSLL